MTMQETEKFIEAVKRYPCLWNVYIPTHKCRETKDAAWREIIQETCITDIDAAKDKWKKLKDAFREALNKRKKDLRLGKKIKTVRPYKFHHVLEFLKPILESGSNGEKMEEASNPDEDTNEQIELYSHSEHDPVAFVQVEPEIRESIPMSTRRGYKRNSSELLDFLMDDTQRRDVSERHSVSQGNELDALDRFFLSMSETIKKLPVPLQLQVKRKVFSAVIEAEEDNIKTEDRLNNENERDGDIKPVIL